VAQAVAVVTRESGWNPAAINNTSDPSQPNYHPPKPGDYPEYSVGLFQINTLVHDVSGLNLTDPLTNIQVAAALWRQEGWTPWGGRGQVPVSYGSPLGGQAPGISASGTAGAGTVGVNVSGATMASPTFAKPSSAVDFLTSLSDFLNYIVGNFPIVLVRLLLIIIGVGVLFISLPLYVESLGD
jgi:hypothetical protein